MNKKITGSIALITLLLSIYATLSWSQSNNYPGMFSLLIGAGATHGGETLAPVTYIFPDGSTTKNEVTTGGDLHYYAGAIIRVSRSLQLWASYGRQVDEFAVSDKEESLIPGTGDINYAAELTRDRLDLMLYGKNGYFRYGLGVVQHRDIVFKLKFTGFDGKLEFEDASGTALGFGLDIPFPEESAAIHLDIKKVWMEYEIQGIALDADHFGLYLSASF